MSELTQGVDSICCVRLCWAVIAFSWASVSSFTSMGTLCLPCCTLGMFGLSVMLYVPGTVPILSKESGNICLRSSILLTVIWSCNWEGKQNSLAKDVWMVYGSVKGKLTL